MGMPRVRRVDGMGVGGKKEIERGRERGIKQERGRE